MIGLFLILALQNLGVELLPLIAGLGVAGAGIALATQGVLSNMVAGLTIIFDPLPVVQVAALADSAVQIVIKPWVQVADYGAIAGELNVSLIEELRRRGIGIAFPQREVRLIGGDE